MQGMDILNQMGGLGSQRDLNRDSSPLDNIVGMAGRLMY